VFLGGALALSMSFAWLTTANAAQASMAGPAAGSSWTIETTPNPAGALVSSLNAVSCTSTKACTAIGSYEATSGGRTLAESWTGKSWRVQATPNPKGTNGNDLYGVSCSSSAACQAVGTAFHKTTSVNTPLAESWNGKNWRLAATPMPKGATDGALFEVSCTSASACTAVGNDTNKAGISRSLIERWNGKSWAIQPSAKAAKRTWLFGVSCASARGCMAAGYQNSGTGDAQLLAEQWNGKSWTVTKTPLPHGAPGGAFSAVSCTSATACTATGNDFGVTAPTLAERWNGKAWKIQPTPNPANYKTSSSSVALIGVSCTTAKACTAIGSYSPGGLAAYFAEVWNGTSWKLQTTPVPKGFQFGSLLGVSCVATRCTAVGAYAATSPQVTLAMAR
jgi:hypothetical protein